MTGGTRPAGTADICIIGAGLAGTAAAFVLAASGHDVVLADIRDVFPPSFRAEKITKAQMALFDRLGLGVAARACAVPYSHVAVARSGFIYRERTVHEYGMSYAALIESLRGAMPPSVRKITGQVTGVTTTNDVQRVVWDDGAAVDARLVIIATGTGHAIQAKLGMGRLVVSPSHSLNFGFNVAPPPGGFPFESLSYHGNGIGDRVAYFTLFRGMDGMRANFYCYRHIGESWAKEFFRNPARSIAETLPGLAAVAGRFEVAGAVAVRPVDLHQTVDYRRAGAVLIGDAFATCCPVVGLGMSKVLTDVDRLCTAFIPQWFATPGMSEAKTSAFYDDLVKRQSDAAALRRSIVTKSIATNPGLSWAIRRAGQALACQGMRAVYRAKPAFSLAGKPMIEACAVFANLPK